MMDDILGVTFGNKHTWIDWGLLQTGPAALSFPIVQTNYVEVPGRDGLLDLSAALTGDVSYQMRDFTVPLMSTATPEDWPALYSQILNAVHGKQLNATLDEDPDYYYMGRFAVDFPTYDGTFQFSITGVVYPYKRKQAITVVTAALTTMDAEITLVNDRQTVIPSITVDAETTLKWGDSTWTIGAGTHTIPDIRLTEGENTLKAKLTAEGTGSITISYQEGSL